MPKLKTAGLFAAGAVGGALLLKVARRRRGGRDLGGRSVLITGGSRGLGLAMAREFAARGCRVAICARGPADGDALPANTLALECDVSGRAAVARMIHAATARLGDIDILVNNAGEIQAGPIESMKIADFEKAMDTMFWGVVYPTLAVLPSMMARRGGRVVNITSIGGKVAIPHLLPYTCAKFAAAGFSEGLRARVERQRRHRHRHRARPDAHRVLSECDF